MTDLLDKILAGLRRLDDGAAVVGALDGETATKLRSGGGTSCRSCARDVQVVQEMVVFCGPLAGFGRLTHAVLLDMCA